MTASPYAGRHIVLPTKHAKAQAIGPAFDELLDARVVEYPFDTDMFGTFSGEVERRGSALDAARCKTREAFAALDADCAVASEGSFGPHPAVGFVPADRELLHFVDRPRDFSLTVTLTSTRTNYRMGEVSDIQDLVRFARRADFPSHALILSSLPRVAGRRIIKGIRDEAALERALSDLTPVSAGGKVWVETDMRASFNPTRMAVIGELARTLARRLETPCPACGLPGWGEVEAIDGLPCEWCGTPTRLVSTLVDGCVRCAHRERRSRPDGLEVADPGHCPYCNP